MIGEVSWIFNYNQIAEHKKRFEIFAQKKCHLIIYNERKKVLLAMFDWNKGGLSESWIQELCSSPCKRNSLHIHDFIMVC